MQKFTRPLVLIVATEPHHAEEWAAELRRVGLEPTRRHAATEADFLARLDAGVDAIVAPLPAAVSTGEFGAPAVLARLHERGLDIPLIAVSDAPDWAAAVTVMKAGAADCVEPARLGAAVQAALAHRAAPADGERADDDPVAMLHALLETTPDIVIFKDRNHIFRACSRAKCEHSGLTREQMIGKSDYDLFPPFQAEQFQAEELAVMSTSGSMTAEHLLDTPHGSRWYEAIKTPVRDARGEIVGILCTERDVTDRKEKEDALRESERRLKRLQEALVELTASAALNRGGVADASREVVEVSARCLEVDQVSVWTLTDDRTLRCLDLYELDADRHAPGLTLDLASYPDYYRALLENRVIAAHDARTDPVTREMRASHLEPHGIESILDAPIRVDGRTVGVLCHTRLGAPRQWSTEEQAFAGSLADMLSLVMERVNRRQIEAERDEQRRMLRVVLDTLPDFILFKDRASVFRVVNRAFTDFFGRSEAEIVGQTDQALFSDPDAERYAAEEQQVMDTGQTLVNEHLLTGPHGLRWDEAIKTPLRDEDGRIIGVLTTGRDVTARKVAEAERDEQRRMLRAVLDTTPDRIVFKDRGFVWRVVNESCARYWERTVESMIGLTDFDLYDTETAQQFRAEELRVMETGELLVIERLHETVNGPRWLEAVKTPLRNDSGQVIGILSVGRDVTEHKQAEIELDEQRRLLRVVLDTTPDMILFKDRDSVYRVVNESCARYWGRTVDEMVGRTDVDLWPADQARAFRAEEVRVMETGEPLVAETLHTTEQGPRWLEAVKTRVCDDQGEVVGVLANVRDIHDRKRAEEVLARRAREMTALYETSLAISAQRDLPSLLQSIVVHAVELIGSRLGEMYLVRADGRTFDMVGSYNLPAELVRPVMHTGEGLTGHTAQTGELLVLEDYCTWGGRACVGAGLHRTLSVPLKRSDQVIGVINVFDTERIGPFDEDEIRLVKLFADQATIALENARLYEAAQRELAERIRAQVVVARRAREMTALYETALAINAQRDIPTLLQSIVQRAVELVGAGVGEVHLMTDDRRTLELASSFNLPSSYAAVVVPVGQGLTGTVAQTGEPMVVEDYCHWEGRLYRDNEFHRALGIPLKSGDRVIGVIDIYDLQKAGPFDEDEIRLVKLFADQATVALENARLYEAARRELAERVRIEADLRRERDFNAGILATTEMAVNVLDAQGRIVLFNRKCQEISGYSEEEVLGRVMWDVLIPPEDVERVRQALGRWPEQEPPAYHENPWLTRDGRRVPLVWRNAALRDPGSGQTLFIGSGMDISERVTREREIERRNRELTLLYETLSAAGASLDPREVYPRVVSALADIGGYPVVVARLPKGDKLVVCAAECYPEFNREMDANVGVIGRVMRTGSPVFAPDVTQDSDYVEWRPDITGQICVPVKVDGEIVALLNIESDAARPLTDDDFRLVLTVAGQLGLMMNNVALYGRLQTEHDRVQGFNEQLLALQHVATAVSSHLDLRELLDTIAQAGTELLGGDSGSIFFADENGVLTIQGAHGLQAETVRSTAHRMGESITGQVAQTGRPIIVDDARTDPRVISPRAQQEGFRSLISVPVVVGKSVIGTLNVHNTRRTHAFTADHERILALLANQAAAAIANARLYAITTESETRYRSLFERSLEGIVLVDAQTGAITDANPAFQTMVGYSLGDLRRRRLSDIQPQDLQESTRRQMLAYQDEGQPLQGTTRFLTLEGRRVDAEFTTWMIEVGGRMFGVASIRDVTDKLQLEDQLRQAQKMEAIGTLAGGIAHDFNNILGAILGYASFIKNGLPTGDPLRRDAETVERSALRGAELTRQLLTFARGNRYEMKPLNLNSAVNETVQLLARTVDKSIAIRPVLEPRLPSIEADAGQIQQLLLNLCLNACEAMAGGGFLAVETKTVRLDAERALRELNKPAGTYVLLSVSDTGHGMDPETLERVFVPFFSTKKDQPGRKHSGLGLAVVFGIVKGHDGVIRVESETGRGTTFRIWLPAGASAGPISAGPAEAPAARGSETILVVDDEEWLRDILERVLGGAGYQVLPAANGADALELFRAQRAQIKLVVLDMIMPGLSGFKVFKMMKEIDPEVCVLISSGYSEQGEAQELLAAGAKGFIQKPFMFQDILNKVRSVLDQECRNPV